MSLLADRVSLRQPSFDLLIHLLHRGETEMMNVVPGRNGIYAAESRVLHSARQNDMTVHPSQTRSQLRERHAHLKRDARFFRQHGHRSAAPDGLEHRVKDRTDFRRLAFKMRLQIVLAAEM